MVGDDEQPGLIPPAKRLSLIPVGLKEAALDSPSFRATTVHFGEQVDAVERWLDNYVKSITKLSNEVTSLETLMHGFLASTTPPALSEAIIDHDYTLLAARRYGEGAKDFWTSTIAGLKKMEVNMIEPIRGFLQGDLRNFKEARRQLETSQRQFDGLQARYSAQVKTKEASALREDAFQLFETRRVYLRASMDFSMAAPQLRMALDKMLVKVFSDHWRALKNCRENTIGSSAKWATDLERIRGWSHEMENGERAFRRELQTARKQIEDSTELSTRPSREIEDYSMSLGLGGTSKGPTPGMLASWKPTTVQSEKQGWLNLRTVTGKPARTVWVRRWFFVKNGIFAWLVQGTRSGGVEESERIGVLLCGVRAAPQEERRFCFEVKTKDTTVVLQAETQPELLEWMATFDVAKKKALEDPSSTDSPGIGASRPLDPAFAISSPSAPEFAASAADSGMPPSLDDSANPNYDRASTLPVPGGDGPRASFDVAAHRRQTGIEKEGDNGRDHTSRLMAKLDLRKTGSPNLQNSGFSPPGRESPSAGGIASLISASHVALPVGPGAFIPPPPPPVENKGSRIVSTTIMRNIPPSTLAPSTFANPPTPTNLSATAVIVHEETGIGIGKSDKTGGMPSGIMANLWGSSNWGYMNRLERGEVKYSSEPKLGFNPLIPQSPSPPRSALGDQLNSTSESTTLGSPSVTANPRKALSLGGDTTDFPRSAGPPQVFPSSYPVQLRHQDAQFRLLFPNVREQEKVVLVFRATWNPSEEQEFPGRVYVTVKDIYFYSNHLGLVLITGLSLSSISEVTAAPGRDCDFLFLHLKETEGKVDFSRITIKTFLEPLKLLQRRLNLLVQNYETEDSLSLESTMKALIKLETDEGQRSPSVESWEEFAGAPREGPTGPASRRPGRDLRANIFVDQGLFGSKPGDNRDIARFKLPNKPVEYAPRGMAQLAVEKIFDISPKALFHVMFGDRSAVWQLLYHERRAQSIKQGPWEQHEENHTRRTFMYQIDYLSMFRQTRQAKIVDTQVIDVFNDHLCYVVTDRKTPWHLPYHQYYMLVSKIVITHVAKSKCKLAIYTNIEWLLVPPITRRLVERKAMSDLELDALDLADVITDQVRKLGAFSRTKKAIQIFGYIGQQNQVTEFGGSNDPTLLHQIRRTMGHRTMTHLILESVGSFMEGVVSSLIVWTIAIIKWLWKTFNANKIILVVLGLSVLTNAFFSSRETSGWWKERNAGQYMRRLGVGPDLVMSKAIYIQDLDIATASHSISQPSPNSTCFHAFQDAASPQNAPSSPSATSQRLRRTRQHLGGYRHDLMVAMRVVNSIEREMMRAEWDHWLSDETAKCTRMDQMLQNTNWTVTPLNGIDEKGLDAVRSRFQMYCESCREARQTSASSRIGA